MPVIYPKASRTLFGAHSLGAGEARMAYLGRALEPALSSVHLRFPRELRGLVGRRQQSPLHLSSPHGTKPGRKRKMGGKAEKEGRETQTIRRLSRIGGMEKSRERGG